MNKIVTRIACLAVTGLMALSISSCTTEDNGTNPNTGTGDGTTTPSGLQFSARSSTSIAVQWTRNTKDVGTDIVTVTNATTGTLITTQNVASPASSVILTGLNPDITYNIKVATSNDDAVTSKWATAYRLPGDNGSSTSSIRIYETADNTNGHFSGLVLNTANPHAASTVGGEANSIDFVLASTKNVMQNCPPPCLSLASPSVTRYTGINLGRFTTFGNTASLIPGGLDNDFYSAPISINTLDSITTYDIYDSTRSGSVVIPFLTADNHYGRLEIMQQPQNQGNKLYGTDPATGFYYIDVRVSYQSELGQGYVGRPNQVRMAGNVTPRSAHIGTSR